MWLTFIWLYLFTSFHDFGLISRSQQCWKVETENCFVSKVWSLPSHWIQSLHIYHWYHIPWPLIIMFVGFYSLRTCFGGKDYKCSWKNETETCLFSTSSCLIKFRLRMNVAHKWTAESCIEKQCLFHVCRFVPSGEDAMFEWTGSSHAWNTWSCFPGATQKVHNRGKDLKKD